MGCGKGVVGGGGYLLAHCWVLRQQELGPLFLGGLVCGVSGFPGHDCCRLRVGVVGCVTGVVV